MWPTVVDNLMRVWVALDLSGPDGAPVQVWEGQPYGWDEMRAGVAVGVDGAYTDGNSGEIEQEWRDAGPAPWANRQESGLVVCTCWYSSGDDDMAAVRTAAFGLLDQLWQAVCDVDSLDPAGQRVTAAWIERADPMLRRQNGVLVEIPFRLRYRAVFA